MKRQITIYSCDKCLVQFKHEDHVVHIENVLYNETNYIKLALNDSYRQPRHYHIDCWEKFWKDYRSNAG